MACVMGLLNKTIEFQTDGYCRKKEKKEYVKRHFSNIGSVHASSELSLMGNIIRHNIHLI